MVVHALPRDLRIVANDLPDDTEESIVGAELHQEVGGVLAAGLASVASRRGAPWGICEEVGLAGLQHRDGRPYSPRPDVFVLAAPIDPTQAEIALMEVGPPLLVIEVASESTWANDVGNKRDAYEGAHVAEYIAFDPTGAYVPEGVQAWRLNATGRFEEWTATAGAWESRVLEVAFVIEGLFLRVRDRDGEVLELARQAPAFLIEARAEARAEARGRRDAEERQQQAEERQQQETLARLAAEEQLRQALSRLQALEDERRRAD